VKTEIQKICNILNHSFEKNAWHGPAVMEVLTDIDESTVHNKIKTTHSIIELIGHMTSWRTFVTERLLGNEGFEVTDTTNFPILTDWHQALDSLRDSQIKLLHALEHFHRNDCMKQYPIVPTNFLRWFMGLFTTTFIIWGRLF
jgi:uncharacterized damage-inducible protein DinB